MESSRQFPQLAATVLGSFARSIFLSSVSMAAGLNHGR